jgi:hypothetical protein
MCAKTLMQRQKDLLVILEKWVRMGGKIKTYEGCFAKSQELTFKPQIEVKLPKGCKCSVDFK